MIDLNLSSLEEDNHLSNKFVCLAHKRPAISLCISSDCCAGSRLSCAICKIRHKTHQNVEIALVMSVLENGKQGIKKSLLTGIEALTEKVNASMRNLTKQARKSAECALLGLEQCYQQDAGFHCDKSQETLARLVNLSQQLPDHYLTVACDNVSKKLKSLCDGQILNDFKKELCDLSFEWELKRFDIEQQVTPNLGKLPLETYNKVKNEMLFDQLELENYDDPRLFLVNDTEFYSISNFNSQGERHGRVIEIPSLNNFFKGYLSSGQRTGKGLYIYQDGSYYLGEFVKNQKQGHGKLMQPNGREYIGEWKEDKKCGVGKELQNGVLFFEGIFEDDERNGPGQELNKDKTNIVQAIYEKGQIKLILSVSQDAMKRNNENKK